MPTIYHAEMPALLDARAAQQCPSYQTICCDQDAPVVQVPCAAPTRIGNPRCRSCQDADTLRGSWGQPRHSYEASCHGPIFEGLQ